MLNESVLSPNKGNLVQCLIISIKVDFLYTSKDQKLFFLFIILLVILKCSLILSNIYLSFFCPIENEWLLCTFLILKQPSASIKPDNHSLK